MIWKAHSNDEKFFLIKPMALAKVFNTLKAMPKGKSPGWDDLNVEFYLFYCHIIGVSLFCAINHFFQNTILPSTWSRTYVVLISKNNNPLKGFDFRLISLCNVCYKLI